MVSVPPLELACPPTTSLQKSARQLQKWLETISTPNGITKPTTRNQSLPENAATVTAGKQTLPDDTAITTNPKIAGKQYLPENVAIMTAGKQPSSEEKCN